ncbi:MAG: efflux RND transporter periplasmic adaptor subunit [Acidobacteriota bacterium]|nr:efflux RND transporter periplasmic adaptor subunit [Acidobacteriota bacterium]
MSKKLFNRQKLPWVITAVLAIALVVVVFAKSGGTASNSNEINGVVQDNSGRRVIEWVDPMISQGPPHTTRAKKPGRALDCGMKLVPLYADETSTSASTSTVSGYANVSLPPARQQIIGVKLAKAEMRDLSRSTRTVGRVAVDERKLAQIHTKFEGFIQNLYVNFTGQPVRRGQPLFSIYSPDLLSTQQELIVAERNRSQFGSTLAESARRRLLLWDMSPADIDRVARSGKPQRDVVFRSPVDGVVLTKNAIQGTRVMPTDTLYEIADLSHVWILADVYEFDLPYLRVGQTAQVALSSMPGQSWIGRVTFISPTLDEKTRTAKVRLELDNRGGLLRPDMYADVILQEPVGMAVAVPDSAVLQTGTRSIAFVDLGNGQFEPREVRTGVKANGYYEIKSGISAGETVAVDANFLIDSESRLKSALSGMGAMQ